MTKVEKQLSTEKVLKQQAINKLAEIMNRKDWNNDKRKNKVKFQFEGVKMQMRDAVDPEKNTFGSDISSLHSSSSRSVSARDKMRTNAEPVAN